MKSNNRIRVKARNIKQLGHLSRDKSLCLFALSLEQHTPKSELWFMSLYKEYKSPNDKFNCPFGPYIPDVINHFFKYVIEIDGSIHNREDIKLKDIRKDLYYTSKGYKVIRIQAYNESSFKQGLDLLMGCR